MRNTAPMIFAKTGYIFLSVGMCAAGLLFIINPAESVIVIGTVTGFIFCAFGIIRIVGYLSKDLFRLAFQYDLAFGVLDIVLGIVLLICPSNALTFAYIALGLCVLADGLFKVQIAIDAKHFGITAWWAILLAAIFTGAIGAALIFRPSLSAEILTVLVGVYMLLDGILNLITVLSSVRIVNHQFKDDVIEAEFREVDPERDQDV